MPLISDSIGRVLGKRYRLLSALGTGASAHVFLAEDVSLQRYVAVKVLLPGLASDEAFLKRFGAEARSVASLNHPHVLRVFDWGEDADGPYLVLEYLGGGSLRDLLDRGVRLTHSQAAHLGTEVAQGLAYAHSRGLVHRDIKPANLLFDEEGRVRVADFGVARALAEAAWTEPAGAMVGTARYISPESAEGKHVDGRADVYSLALVLYEAVTGTVPFVADTTMATLMARVGTPLPHHEALGPLDDVLARAAAPQASSRLDAAGLAARLGALASALPTPTPLPLQAPHEALVPMGSGRPPDAQQLTAVAAPSGPPAPVGTRAGPGEIFDAEPGGGKSSGTPGSKTVPAPAAKRRSRRNRFWIIGAVAAVLALIAGGTVWAMESNVFTPSHPTPSVVSLTMAQARAAAARDHFTLHVEKGLTSTMVAVGSIISQSPKPGTVMKEGSTLNVVPSTGKPTISVPSLSGGLTCPQAIAALLQAHLVGVCGAAAYSDTVASGQVISWAYGSIPNPTSAPFGSTITVTPSQGHSPVTVPSIPSSYTFGEAQAALQVAGLVAAQANASSTTVPAGQIISTSPASGQPAPYGGTVTVTVSTGPPLISVPSVQGDTVPEANTTLTNAGLQVSSVNGNPSRTVTGTSPPAGTQVQPGSSVVINTR
ncbi:MAG TPA: PASTA domain-containing protein [Acidimicrobiales bacterium]|nr:PASTA domain-containing protein [Acidimicrobiales bacterium]